MTFAEIAHHAIILVGMLVVGIVSLGAIAIVWDYAYHLVMYIDEQIERYFRRLRG